MSHPRPKTIRLDEALHGDIEIVATLRGEHVQSLTASILREWLARPEHSFEAERVARAKRLGGGQ